MTDTAKKSPSGGSPKPKVHVRTVGCPKNVVDSELMMGAFGAKDYDLADGADDADVLVVNTCGFIGMAREASIQAILDLAKVKEGKQNARLVVTGCLSQRFADELVSSLPEVDLFVGSGSATEVPQLVEELPEEQDTELRVPVVRVGKPDTLGVCEGGRRVQPKVHFLHHPEASRKS